jgi:hypothetical protein
VTAARRRRRRRRFRPSTLPLFDRRTCSGCGRELPASDVAFPVHRRGPGGLDYQCLICHGKAAKRSRAEKRKVTDALACLAGDCRRLVAWAGARGCWWHWPAARDVIADAFGSPPEDENVETLTADEWRARELAAEEECRALRRAWIENLATSRPGAEG